MTRTLNFCVFKIYLECSLRLKTSHETGGHAQGGGQNLLVHSLCRGRALFSYINLQVTDSAWGAEPRIIFIWEQCPRAGYRFVRLCDKSGILGRNAYV